VAVSTGSSPNGCGTALASSSGSRRGPKHNLERRYAWERWLGFGSGLARIPHEGWPIYKGFTPWSCVARIRP
jgi:hypothetical protein